LCRQKELIVRLQLESQRKQATDGSKPRDDARCGPAPRHRRPRAALQPQTRRPGAAKRPLTARGAAGSSAAAPAGARGDPSTDFDRLLEEFLAIAAPSRREAAPGDVPSDVPSDARGRAGKLQLDRGDASEVVSGVATPDAEASGAATPDAEKSTCQLTPDAEAEALRRDVEALRAELVRERELCGELRALILKANIFVA
jgi:hypothetical protein